MTVTIDQALNGLERFANSELIPRLPEGIGVAAAILMRMAKDGGKERLLAMKDNFFVQLTGALDEEGNVDIDRLYKYARDEIDGKKIKLFSIKDKDMRFVAESMGIQAPVVPHWAWGVTMNMMYSDYYPVAVEFGLNRPEFYAALAKAFLIDKDGPGPERKLMEYYEHVVK